MIDSDREKEWEAAGAAVVYAQQMRKLHRRRTSPRSPVRIEQVNDALARIAEAMPAIRRRVGMHQWGPQGQEAEKAREIERKLSEAMQRERRKLRKMINVS